MTGEWRSTLLLARVRDALADRPCDHTGKPLRPETVYFAIQALLFVLSINVLISSRDVLPGCASLDVLGVLAIYRNVVISSRDSLSLHATTISGYWTVSI